MKEFIKNSILFTLPAWIAVGLLFCIPSDKKFSYHFVKGECDNQASWIYQRVFENPAPVDLAFIGASQTGCAIMDEQIEQMLNRSTGKTQHVVNLGYCRRGRDLQYVMLKDLFSRKRPSTLVIEVAEDEPKKSHPVFPYLAETTDLWGSAVFFNQRYLSHLYKGIIVRFEQLKSSLFRSASMEPNDAVSNFGYRASDQQASANDLNQNKLNWQKRKLKPKPAFLRSIELNYSRHYLEKMVKLANNNHCTVVFLYLPESGSNIKMPLLADYYTTFGPLITLPDSVVTNSQNWKDATHFNNSGAKKTSAWIAEKIALYQQN